MLFHLLLLLPLIAGAPLDPRQDAAAAGAMTPSPPPTPSPSPPPPTPSPPPPTPKGVELHPYDRKGNVIKNKCLDVRAGSFTNGSPVQM
jgi:hypothetical protein